MRKVTKRAISIFLAVLMTLSVLPVTAFAAEEYPLMIYNDGVRVDENGDNPLRIKEPALSGARPHLIWFMWTKTVLSRAATAPRALLCAFG